MRKHDDDEVDHNVKCQPEQFVSFLLGFVIADDFELELRTNNTQKVMSFDSNTARSERCFYGDIVS